MDAQFDLVIRNGNIVDGSGNPAFTGDVAVSGGRIVAVGNVAGTGAQEIDAAQKLVTPGFVDIHTHYDGQAIWESTLAPSSGHGVTTVIIGNCGVGFAPCRAQDRDRLVRLMEGVEDIPGVVMTEGLSWEWESYPEYLNALEARPHDINIASYLPHSPLRVYVMGERAAAGEEATPDDIEQMAALTREAMQAGALGFATSRTLFHRSSDGELIPTLDAGEAELTGIGQAMRAVSDGVMQIANDYKGATDIAGEFALMKRVAQTSGCILSLPMAQMHNAPESWREIAAMISDANAEGMRINGQVMPRGLGMLFGLDHSMHPFCLTPGYHEIAHLPLPERVAKMLEPATRARILAEPPGDPSVPLLRYIRLFNGMFEMGEAVDYEPPLENSIAARAAGAGTTPEALAYDLLLAQDGHGILFMPFANYAYGNLDTTLEMLRHKHLLPGLGDGGAHYGAICDASYSTFLLSYWTRDRIRGERMSVPEAVRAMTHDTAAMMGLHDRGLIAPGYAADLNVIDYDRLFLHAPRIAHDLPGGGKRLTQKADGFAATIVNGEIVYRNGTPTGRLPGKLIRGRIAA
jgi:N-acyl-D-amino-acid deacylase